MPKCRLCLQEKLLLSKSHVIPSFLFEPLFVDTDKLYEIYPGQFYKPGVPKVKRHFDSPYQSGILCATCDNEVIGGYEDYAAKVLFGGAASFPRDQWSKLVQVDQSNEFVWHNVNYTKYKLFLLSMIWRASISTQPMFNQVNLGPHEERIRKMLWTGNAGKEEDYPVLMFVSLNEKHGLNGSVSQFHKRKGRHGAEYFVNIAGMFLTYYTSGIKLPRDKAGLILKPNNTMKIMGIPPIMADKLLESLAGLTQEYADYFTSLKVKE